MENKKQFPLKPIKASLDFDGKTFQLTPNSLIIHGKPSFQEWERFGEVLQYLTGSIHWWIGDWLTYGERRYGEMYSQALHETSFTYGTLRNDKWVASKFKPEERHRNLTFCHHYAAVPLMKLDSEKTHELLNIAEEKSWTGDQLRSAIKELSRLPRPFDPNNTKSPLRGTLILLGDLDTAAGKEIEDKSIDFIITRPPEVMDFIPPLYEFAKRVLKTGKNIVIITHQRFLGELFKTFFTQSYFGYYWIAAISGGSFVSGHEAINSSWRPLVIFFKFPFIHTNRMFDDPVEDLSLIIDIFTEVGDTVCDPFADYGELLISAYDLGRDVVGIEADDAKVDIIEEKFYNLATQEEKLIR